MGCSPGPREQLTERVDWVASDESGEDICEIGLRIDAIQFAGFDERSEDGEASSQVPPASANTPKRPVPRQSPSSAIAESIACGLPMPTQVRTPRACGQRKRSQGKREGARRVAT